MAKRRQKVTRRHAAGPEPTIRAWQDDPGTGFLMDRPVPNLAQRPLAFSFDGPTPKPASYQPGTAEFRYWTAAEALRRGADFWAQIISLQRWQPGPVLRVLLDEGLDLNAFYDRNALNFFHGPSPNGTVFSDESPDIVCHEMGHAILDSLKPQLWGVGSHEAAAFHESFGDISAILSALQLKELRTAILSDTGGHLYQSSRLSRLAEQLATAIRAQQPDAVEPDSLRNAVNRFSYEDPISLPPIAPASQLSSEPHSFSRVFTGAFYEALGGMLTAMASNPSAPSHEELLSVANDLASILVNAIIRAPVVSNWFAQVAAMMVQLAGDIDPTYPAILKGVFVRRSILSLDSATTVQLVHKSMAAMRPSDGEQREPLARAALSGTQYGLERPVLVETPSQARRFAVTAAAGNADPIEPASAITAAKAFLDDLFRGGHVDYGKFAKETRIEHGRRLRSHRLVPENGSIRLERVLFDCGLCCG